MVCVLASAQTIIRPSESFHFGCVCVCELVRFHFCAIGAPTKMYRSQGGHLNVRARTQLPQSWSKQRVIFKRKTKPENYQFVEFALILHSR